MRSYHCSFRRFPLIMIPESHHPPPKTMPPADLLVCFCKEDSYVRVRLLNLNLAIADTQLLHIFLCGCVSANANQSCPKCAAMNGRGAVTRAEARDYIWKPCFGLNVVAGYSPRRR